MASTISAGTTTTTSLVYTADTSGVLQLQTNGTITAVTIDTSQNVGVGVTPYASWSSFGKAVQLGSTGVFAVASGGSNTNLADNWQTNGSADYYITTNYATRYKQTSGQHQWFVAPSGSANTSITFTQAMTLNNSGNLFLGTTSNGIASSCRATFYNDGSSSMTCATFTNQSGTSSGQPVAYYYHAAASGGTSATQIAFLNGSAGTVGTITSTGSATAYNTSSDRRLKSNITDLTNSGTIIDSLKPRAFTWISDNSADAGFIADELQTVLPKAVTGQPNATKEEEYEVTPAVKDSMGNITTPAVMGTRTVPVYQMIDASQPELIAYLVAEVQSLRARLKAANIA